MITKDMSILFIYLFIHFFIYFFIYFFIDLDINDFRRHLLFSGIFKLEIA